MTVHTEHHGHVTIVRIDRPAKKNAIDGPTTDGIDAALNEFDADDSAAVAIITGGQHVFSAGTDLVHGAGRPTARGGPYGVTRRSVNKPAIAAVEGVAAGGGFEIVLACTLVTASRTATFSLPEVQLGLVAECGGLFRTARALPLNVAREMLLTGTALSAERAAQLGLVNRLSEPGHALDSAVELAEEIIANAPIAVTQTLDVLEQQHPDDDALWAATDTASKAARASADAREGVAAFHDRREPRWIGS